jgi:hypothetical protein
MSTTHTHVVVTTLSCSTKFWCVFLLLLNGLCWVFSVLCWQISSQCPFFFYWFTTWMDSIWNIRSYLKTNIFFLKILTSLNIEHKLPMNNQVSDTTSGEPLFLFHRCNIVGAWVNQNEIYKIVYPANILRYWKNTRDLYMLFI